MSYSDFLLVFLVAPIILLLIANTIDVLRHKKLPDELTNFPYYLTVCIHLLISVIYTTPWDNYLVANRVWFYEPALVWGITIGWVPLEEYMFFILQTFLTSLWILWLMKHLNQTGIFYPSPKVRQVTTSVLILTWIISAVSLALNWSPGTYLNLILIWALPPIIIQIAFAGDILWHQWKLALLAILPITIFLGLADSLAIHNGIWTISSSLTTGIKLPFQLPIEEFIFFFLTNILVVFGTILFQSCESKRRLFAILPKKYSNTL